MEVREIKYYALLGKDELAEVGRDEFRMYIRNLFANDYRKFLKYRRKLKTTIRGLENAMRVYMQEPGFYRHLSVLRNTFFAFTLVRRQRLNFKIGREIDFSQI